MSLEEARRQYEKEKFEKHQLMETNSHEHDDDDDRFDDLQNNNNNNFEKPRKKR